MNPDSRSAPSKPRRARLLVPALLAVAVAIACTPAARAEPPPNAYTPQQLDELVAPVALYPDVVLDSLLPATATPADVAAAAQYVQSQGGAVAAVPQNVQWSGAVVALLQFPDVLRWLAENPAWTEQMGWAMANQPEDVLDAIQRYRARAKELGILETNRYQRVVAEPSYIVIEPAVPDIVYVPVYDPWMIYRPGFVYGPGVSFYRSWWSFSFGFWGPWSWHEIWWDHDDYHHHGIYEYSRAWWWNRWRGRAYDWGRDRPTLWDSRNVRIHTSSRPRELVRPSLPTVTRTVDVRRDVRTRLPARATDLAPPSVRPDLRRRVTTSTGTTTPFGSGTTTPDLRRRTTPDVERRVTPDAPRRTRPVVPKTTPTPSVRERVTPPGGTGLTPGAGAVRRVTPSVRSGSTVFDRPTIEAWSRRGSTSIRRNAEVRSAPKRSPAEVPSGPSVRRQRDPRPDSETPPPKSDDEERRRRR